MSAPPPTKDLEGGVKAPYLAFAVLAEYTLISL
jgi:hypothetical protein